MSKKKTNKEDEVVTQEESVPDFSHKAYGMFSRIENGKRFYILAEIGYDPVSGDVGFIKEVSKDIKEDIIDKIKAKLALEVFIKD